MGHPHAPPDAPTRLATAIATWVPSTPVLVVALDGRRGAGKSTLASAVATEVGASVIGGDDFYAGGTAEEWDGRTPADKAERCIDWRRQRTVLEAVRRGEAPTWRAFDWEAFDGRLEEEVRHRPAAAVVILEGVYTARPELADLVDRRVLLDTPIEVRHRQLVEREGDGHDAGWERRWNEAEDHYFGVVVPREVFDLVLPWTPADPADPTDPAELGHNAVNWAEN